VDFECGTVFVSGGARGAHFANVPDDFGYHVHTLTDRYCDAILLLLRQVQNQIVAHDHTVLLQPKGGALEKKVDLARVANLQLVQDRFFVVFVVVAAAVVGRRNSSAILTRRLEATANLHVHRTGFVRRHGVWRRQSWWSVRWDKWRRMRMVRRPHLVRVGGWTGRRMDRRTRHRVGQNRRRVDDGDDLLLLRCIQGHGGGDAGPHRTVVVGTLCGDSGCSRPDGPGAPAKDGP
jgi:hypothetical protein